MEKIREEFINNLKNTTVSVELQKLISEYEDILIQTLFPEED